VFFKQGRRSVSWKSRDGPSARLGSALGRWNPIEQAGLCIYSCLRTYRSELFNRVLSNQPTRREVERGTHREKINLPFVFFKEGRRREREREKKEKEEEEEERR
jgi:hypothetical protein